jgi:hypothetical protein
MPKSIDPDFKENFEKLMAKKNLEPRHFCGVNVPRKHRIPPTTFKNVRKGHPPRDPELVEKFAAIFGIPVKQFLSPQKQLDWERPDVNEFIGADRLRAIDGAVEIHRGVERDGDKFFWDITDIHFKIEDRPVGITELPSFQSIISKWATEHPGEAKGIKYCVTEVVRPMSESSPKLTLCVRPIEYHFIKPINDVLTLSYDDNGQSFMGESISHQLRKKHFGRLNGLHEMLFPNFLTCQISVISKDHKLILHRRTTKYVDSFRGYWSASFEEGFNADWKKYLPNERVYSGLKTPDLEPRDGFFRALREEVKLADEVIQATDIQALGFVVEFANLNTAITALAKVPLFADEIISGLIPSEEADRFAYCSFDMPTLLPVFLDRNIPPPRLFSPGKDVNEVSKGWKWHPTSRMRIFQSLANEYGHKKVLNNIERKQNG